MSNANSDLNPNFLYHHQPHKSFIWVWVGCYGVQNNLNLSSLALPNESCSSVCAWEREKKHNCDLADVWSCLLQVTRILKSQCHVKDVAQVQFSGVDVILCTGFSTTVTRWTLKANGRKCETDLWVRTLSPRFYRGVSVRVLLACRDQGVC